MVATCKGSLFAQSLSMLLGHSLSQFCVRGLQGQLVCSEAHQTALHTLLGHRAAVIQAHWRGRQARRAAAAERIQQQRRARHRAATFIQVSLCWSPLHSVGPSLDSFCPADMRPLAPHCWSQYRPVSVQLPLT